EIDVRALACRAPRLSARESSGKSAGSPSRATARAGIGLGCRRINVVRVKPDLVVNLPFLGVTQNIVGFGKRLKFLFGTFVPGIDVRMIFPRKFAKGFANVLGGRRLLDPEGR